MRFKLGLLQDSASIEKQIAREAAEAQAKKHKHETPTVKTEAAQHRADEAAARDAEKNKEKSKEPPKSKPKIRPLSEAKAIDSGANFVSETFLLLVGVALILGENWRQSRKASNRREDIAERIAELEEQLKTERRGMVGLEREIIRIRGGANQPSNYPTRILPKEVWELEEKEEAEDQPKIDNWWSWIKWQTAKVLPQQERQQEKPASESAPAAATPVEETKKSMFERILPAREAGPHSTQSNETSISISEISGKKDIPPSRLNSEWK